ncbi:MAG: hypothetical protein COT74_10055 [Bdellovibrionales bacterium CG10_big_fil_rev_8_21_14_0_10_45_34]|nr:MAG: hypothetical protein COT74_10055 [Bdellovibrionales bacterium CG10_big_fil_rev_8_21_14_0_10_45_34]
MSNYKVQTYLASEKKFDESVLIVPFFGAELSQLRRHIQFLNELGFDVYAIQFSEPRPRHWFTWNGGFKLGLKHRWAREISLALNRLPGKKIIYGFSNPASSAIEAVSIRRARDVVGAVCDSGPFMSLWKCNWRYLTESYGVTSPTAKFPLAVATLFLWGADHETSLSKDFEKLPGGFPILSIRGWRDKIVPVSAIEEAFNHAPQVDLTILSLPDADHLDGLKKFPELYESKVAEFMCQIAQKTQ